jgi:hypothetical protein
MFAAIDEGFCRINVDCLQVFFGRGSLTGVLFSLVQEVSQQRNWAL